MDLQLLNPQTTKTICPCKNRFLTLFVNVPQNGVCSTRVLDEALKRLSYQIWCTLKNSRFLVTPGSSLVRIDRHQRFLIDFLTRQIRESDFAGCSGENAGWTTGMASPEHSETNSKTFCWKEKRFVERKNVLWRASLWWSGGGADGSERGRHFVDVENFVLFDRRRGGGRGSSGNHELSNMDRTSLIIWFYASIHEKYVHAFYLWKNSSSSSSLSIFSSWFSKSDIRLKDELFWILRLSLAWKNRRPLN